MNLIKTNKKILKTETKETEDTELPQNKIVQPGNKVLLKHFSMTYTQCDVNQGCSIVFSFQIGCL